MRRTLLPLACLALGACAAGNNGLESLHQPLVAGRSASVPGCPDWRDGTNNVVEDTGANYGCATNANLAAMVVDAQDLVHGKAAPDGADAETNVRALRAWRGDGGGKGGAAAAPSAAPKGN